MKKCVFLLTLFFSFFATMTFAAPVNVNTASAQELQQNLIGVGKNKAKAIIVYRENNGPFTSFASLKRVKGIGPKILEKNKKDILFK